MCPCRDVIYWFCLVGSLCSERHKSGLHYTIKGPLMQRAREHDGFSEDQQSFEGEQHSVSLNAACKSSTDSLRNGPGYCRKLFGFRSFTQLSITFYFRFPRWWFYWRTPPTNARGPPLRITRLQRLQPSVTGRQSTCGVMEGGTASSPAQHNHPRDEGGHNHPPSKGGFGLLHL